MKDNAIIVGSMLGCVVGMFLVEKVREHFEHKRRMQDMRNYISYMREVHPLM